MFSFLIFLKILFVRISILELLKRDILAEQQESFQVPKV